MDVLSSCKMITMLAMASGAGGGSPQGGASQMIAFMFPMILLFVVMYFLMIRPQMKQEKERQEMLSKIKKNDMVLTKGGIIGKVVSAKDDVLVVQIDPQKDVCVRMRREGVNTVLKDEKNKKEDTSEISSEPEEKTTKKNSKKKK